MPPLQRLTRPFRSARTWITLGVLAPVGMLAIPYAFVLYHRERLAVFLSSALFLAGALPLFWAIG